MPTLREVHVPDIGNFDTVSVLEVLVSPGDRVAVEDSIVTLESDKASMDVPSPFAGVVQELKVAPGAKVGQGALLLVLEADEAAAPAPKAEPAPAPSAPAAPAPVAAPPAAPAPPTPEPPASLPTPAPAVASQPGPSILFDDDNLVRAYAGPAVRRYARELGVDLLHVEGSGRKGRIQREDVNAYVKQALTASPSARTATPAAGSGFLTVAPLPAIDFSRFGPVETVALSRIRKLSAANLHRSWVTAPHVTQHDEADITELEAFRRAAAEEPQAAGVKLTLLAFLIKAAVAALRQFPDFNASLSPDGENLLRKGYYNVGIAVDTPNGLVVPVIRDADSKSLLALARELGEVSARARDGKLRMDDLQGGTFSISSLGGIGGTAFTPIINVPEVAILGVSRAAQKPVWQDGQFVPRLLLPLSLSYDHRVIDGAAAARFTTYLGRVLADIRRLLL
jgi:pyruvate dehydrogenase E2 component (dihydrolipoamide acetyltransferase)